MCKITFDCGAHSVFTQLVTKPAPHVHSKHYRDTVPELWHELPAAGPWQEWSAPREISGVSMWDSWIMNLLKTWWHYWASCGLPNCSVFPFAASQKEVVFLIAERAGQDGQRKENFWDLGTRIQRGTHKCPWADPPAHLNCPSFVSCSCPGLLAQGGSMPAPSPLWERTALTAAGPG